VIDAATNTIEAEVNVGGNPGRMVWDPAQSRLYVANQGSHISVIRDSGAGIQQGDSRAAAGRPLPTIVRGVLLLPEAVGDKRLAVGAHLLDISGRKVLDLKPGTNDVRALAPGVYFVRTAQAQAQAQAVRKVVLTK